MCCYLLSAIEILFSATFFLPMVSNVVKQLRKVIYLSVCFNGFFSYYFESELYLINFSHNVRNVCTENKILALRT